MTISDHMVRIFRPSPYHPGSPTRYRYPKWFDPQGLEQQPISDADLINRSGYRTTMSYNANLTGAQFGQFPRRRFFMSRRRRPFASPRYIRNVVRRSSPKDINRGQTTFTPGAGSSALQIAVGVEDPADTSDDVDTNSVISNLYVEAQPTEATTTAALYKFALFKDDTNRTSWTNWHSQYMETDTNPGPTTKVLRAGTLTYRRFYLRGDESPPPKFVLQPNRQILRKQGYFKELSRIWLAYDGPAAAFEVYWRFSYRKL